MKNPISPVRSPIMAALTTVALAAGPALASPPAVTSTVPSQGALGVAINIPIIATFSKAMNGNTINASTFRLDKVVPGTLTFNLRKNDGSTTQYVASYTTEPFAGIYGGNYTGSSSGNFFTGVSGEGELKGFSYNSSEADYFVATLAGNSPLWSFSTYSYSGASFSGTLSAGSTSGIWQHGAYSGQFIGAKILGNNGSTGYNKSVYTARDYYWVAAAEVSGSTITGDVVDLAYPDVFYGTGTVYANDSFSIPYILSGRYQVVVASATGTLNKAAVSVAGSVVYDASTSSAVFTPYSNLSPNSIYRATVSHMVTDASGTPMAADKTWSFTTGISTASKLSITVSGSGAGEIDSSPSGIACSYPLQSGFCWAYFTNPSVSLNAVSSPGSRFSGWGGACAACAANPCIVILNSSKNCSAGFALLMVIIDGNPSVRYATIQEAYDAAANDALLKARVGTTSEDILLDRDRKVTIKGGYNSNFSSQSGFTAIDGSLTVGAGELTVADLKII